MEILITNDDGYQAKGLEVLARCMQPLGHITVLAPDGPRSGQSNALSFGKMLRLRQIKQTEAMTVYTTNGTPSDCIKLALNTLYKEGKPDLIVSGINHGSNAAVNVIYSGTMGAVFVGAENDILSIGFSLCDHDAQADFSHFAPYLVPLTHQLLAQPRRHGLCYNINAPKGEIKGIRVTRQCAGHWSKEVETYMDPLGEPFYVLKGEFVNHEPEVEETDEWALAHGYISVTPTDIDMSDKEWNALTNIG